MQITNRRLGLAALVTTAALALTACGGGSEAGTTDSSASASSSASSSAGTSAEAQSFPLEIEDMAGNQVTIESADSIIATDNRIFRTLEDWGVELSAAPLGLMNEGTVDYPSDDSIIDLGSHREPNLEGFVEAEPDLVLNGQRFSGQTEAIKPLIGDAAFLDTNVVEGEPLEGELRRQTTLLGDIFAQQAEAEALVADFDAAIEEAKGAYDAEQTVVGLIATGGDLSYAAPSTGRAIGPVFDMLELTPALEREGSTNHQGDDISVEAIAEANPDWLLVMDRDAATSSDEGTQPAAELIEGSEALQDVTAVKEGNIVYLPEDFYVHEDIQNYTTFLNDLAEAFGA
ncbi:ABC transporter substrate-binding protein [Citricoccus nitrophenolicus]|uniref:Iron complex transport system substrate-binding protein n=1 Tax=Citricoccus muralis TaxID=169134 RepID=A0A3D9LBF2_9MICC|nr:ABC transporter substrate-binding protein [Citricoccus muralis]REE03701.1 iron complex transport system substrate-binding protein [Citricoccus muralis]